MNVPSIVYVPPGRIPPAQLKELRAEIWNRHAEEYKQAGWLRRIALWFRIENEISRAVRAWMHAQQRK